MGNSIHMGKVSKTLQEICLEKLVDQKEKEETRIKTELKRKEAYIDAKYEKESKQSKEFRALEKAKRAFNKVSTKISKRCEKEKAKVREAFEEKRQDRVKSCRMIADLGGKNYFVCHICEKLKKRHHFGYRCIAEKCELNDACSNCIKENTTLSNWSIKNDCNKRFCMAHYKVHDKQCSE